MQRERKTRKTIRFLRWSRFVWCQFSLLDSTSACSLSPCPLSNRDCAETRIRCPRLHLLGELSPGRWPGVKIIPSLAHQPNTVHTYFFIRFDSIRLSSHGPGGLVWFFLCICQTILHLRENILSSQRSQPCRPSMLKSCWLCIIKASVSKHPSAGFTENWQRLYIQASSFAKTEAKAISEKEALSHLHFIGRLVFILGVDARAD